MTLIFCKKKMPQKYLIVCPPANPTFWWGEGTGVTESQFLEEDDIFQGSYSFYVKNTFKSEIFNEKKSFEKIFFSVINKNLNWEF